MAQLVVRTAAATIIGGGRVAAGILLLPLSGAILLPPLARTPNHRFVYNHNCFLHKLDCCFVCFVERVTQGYQITVFAEALTPDGMLSCAQSMYECVV